MLQYLLAKHLNITKDDERYRHVSLILLYILSCIAITTFYCFYNSVIFDYPKMFYIDFAGTILGLVALYVLLGLKRIQLASFVLLLMAISAKAVEYTAIEHRTALRQVDEALYLAKMSGKNCYRLALDKHNMHKMCKSAFFRRTDLHKRIQYAQFTLPTLGCRFIGHS